MFLHYPPPALIQVLFVAKCSHCGPYLLQAGHGSVPSLTNSDRHLEGDPPSEVRDPTGLVATCTAPALHAFPEPASPTKPCGVEVDFPARGRRWRRRSHSKKSTSTGGGGS